MNERDYNMLADTTAAIIESAFIAQVDEIAQGVTVSEVRRLVQQDDYEGIVALMVGLLGFVAFTEAMRRAFLAAGQAEMESIPRSALGRAIAAAIDPTEGGRLVVTPARPIVPGFVGPSTRPPVWTPEGTPPAPRPAVPRVPPFNPRRPAAIDAIARVTDEVVSGIQQAQQAAVRAVVQSGRALGRTAQQIAQDIVGRSHAGSRRVGGVIGLGEGESRWLAGAREQLQSNDPAQLRQYLTRSLRDRRFDAAVRKAIETGKAIPATTIERAVTRYGERLLRHRAEMLGQVAAREAIGAGRQESINQLVEQGILRASNVRKRWQTVGDEKVRSTHRAMNEQERGLNAPFTSPSGAQMMYPGDQSLGAPLEEIANCRCHLEYEL